MRSHLTEYRQELSTGVVVQRLPLGFAAGRWWATFVSAVPGWEGREPAFDYRAMSMAVGVHDPDGGLECVGGSGGGSERALEHTWELLDHGATRAQVSYREGDREVASELLKLQRADRTGHFATRLPDGSLVERLPLGHAHGMWRLRWVRSEVPQTEMEIDSSEEDERALDMPHVRLLRFRTPEGTVTPRGASGALGGPVQPFAVDLPDTVTDLEVDYLFEAKVVGTESLPLPEIERG